jgi:hypothetical protein
MVVLAREVGCHDRRIISLAIAQAIFLHHSEAFADIGGMTLASN